MGILGGGGFGGLVNSITGASQSARQQNQYAVGMSKLNYAQQKDMLLNGPSWQMEGYDKAGVNPTYGLGGLHQGGGTASGTGGGGGGLGLFSAIADIYNNTRATDAKIGLDQANAELAKAQAGATKRGTMPQMFGELGGDTVNSIVTSAKKIWKKDKEKYEKAKDAKDAWNNIMNL